LFCSNTSGYGAKSWKVAGSIPESVIGIFHIHNSSGRSMALGSTYCLSDTSPRNIFWGDKGSPPLCADCLEIWEPHSPRTPRACPDLYRDCVTFNISGSRIQIFNTDEIKSGKILILGRFCPSVHLPLPISLIFLFVFPSRFLASFK